MSTPEQRIETAINEAVTDAYRCGVGTAIRIAEVYRELLADGHTLDLLIAELRTHSAGI